MTKDYENYLKIKEAYKESNVLLVEKKFGNIKLIIFYLLLIVSYPITIFTSYILIDFKITKLHEILQKYQDFIFFVYIIISFVFLFFIYRLAKMKIKNATIKYGAKEYGKFIQSHSNYWIGIRALLFFEKIKDINLEATNKDKIFDILKIEFEHNEYDIFKMPIFVATIAFLSILLNSFFSQFPSDVLLGFIIAVLVIMWVLYVYFEITRTKKIKFEEIKLFLYWYDIVYSKEGK